MRPFARAVIIAAIASLPLGGCVNFDPTEWLAGDWFNNKKPLPGERKALFPEGVPGVGHGVPPELMKGNQAAALQEAEPSPIELPDEPKQKPKAKPKAKPKPKPKVVRQVDEPARQPTPVTVRPPAQPAQPASQPAQPASQWPDPPPAQRPAPRQQQVQWPDPPGAKKAPSSQVQWPDPPAPN